MAEGLEDDSHRQVKAGRPDEGPTGEERRGDILEIPFGCAGDGRHCARNFMYSILLNSYHSSSVVIVSYLFIDEESGLREVK